jgi:hypothetical protein
MGDDDGGTEDRRSRDILAGETTAAGVVDRLPVRVNLRRWMQDARTDAVGIAFFLLTPAWIFYLVWLLSDLVRDAIRSRRPHEAVEVASERLGDLPSTCEAGPVVWPSGPKPVPRFEPIVATRAWRVALEPRSGDDLGVPALQSLFAGGEWSTSRLTATCIHEHVALPPQVDCQCGVYAVRDEALLRDYPRLPVRVVGAVALSGVVIEATRGYRAEHARIVGPLRLRMACWGGPGAGSCREPVVGVGGGPGELLPLCKGHGGGGGRPVEQVASRLAARLELRYGVTVEFERSEAWISDES